MGRRGGEQDRDGKVKGERGASVSGRGDGAVGSATPRAWKELGIKVSIKNRPKSEKNEKFRPSLPRL